jgi:hypothetical protein
MRGGAHSATSGWNRRSPSPPADAADVDEALKVADDYRTYGYNAHCISLITLAAEVRRLREQPAAAPAAEQRLTEEHLRALWVSRGGRFHGPNVETGTMPEAQLLPFLRALAAKGAV